MKFSWFYLFASTVIAWAFSNAEAKGDREYRILDSLREQTVSGLSWSPDGAFLAYSVRRSAADEQTNSIDFYWRKSRDEISLWERGTGDTTKLNLPGDGSAGAWDMAWSEDGAYLAFLSDAEGGVNLWVWDREDKAVRQLTMDGVGRMGCEWVAITDMLCGVSETDGYQKPNYSSGGRGFGGDIDAVRDAWARAERGENTADAVDSLSFPHHPHTVFRVNPETGMTRKLGSAYLDYNRGRDFAFKPSPDGDHVVLRTNASSAFPHFIRSRSGHPGEISIVRLDGAPLDIALPSDVILSTVNWSPDGRYLGFFALNGKSLHKDVLYEGKWASLVYPDVPSREYPGGFYIVDTEDKTVRQLDLETIDLGRAAQPPKHAWLGSDRISFYTVLRDERMTEVRPRWLVLDLTGKLMDGPSDPPAEPVRPPRRGERSIAFNDDLVAFTKTENGVQRLSVKNASGAETLLELNTHMDSVRRFDQRVFSYTSANGNEAKGVITFPYDYNPKYLYPTVVDSDIGYGVHSGSRTSRLYELPEDSLESTDAATFAAAGYVYVFLSMPTNELDDVGRANLLSFSSGILPGVDWLVREGVADPDRVFLFGGE